MHSTLSCIPFRRTKNNGRILKFAASAEPLSNRRYRAEAPTLSAQQRTLAHTRTNHIWAGGELISNSRRPLPLPPPPNREWVLVSVSTWFRGSRDKAGEPPQPFRERATYPGRHAKAAHRGREFDGKSRLDVYHYFFFFVVPGPQGENLCPTL